MVLAFWCLLLLLGGDTRTLCLDLEGRCSPSAAVPVGPCHDETPDNGLDASCSACVDVLVPADASARSNRPDLDHRAAAPVLLAVNGAPGAVEPVVSTSAGLLFGQSSLHPCRCAAVLRI